MPPSRPKKTRYQSRKSTPEASGERLQKVLAAAGLGSRRKCEELIVQGRIEVDRKIVTELGTRINPLTAEIRVDGETLRRSKAVYFMVNKPPGVLSTNYDPEYRVRVVDLVKSSERLFTIGRLDQYSEGLILVTNDGELANRLTHPRYGATKTYHVVVAGAIEPKTLARLERGVHLAEGMARVASLKVKKQRPQSTELEMVLEEGKNREVRRVFAAVGHKVLRLRRVQIGPIKLADLPVGAHRPLSKEELEKLHEYAFAVRKREPKPKRPPRAAKPEQEYDDEPLIDLSDEAIASDTASGPVLVDEDLVHFEKGVRDEDGFTTRKPGAVIAFEDDDAPPVHVPPKEKRPPGKFSKQGRRAEEERGKKKFARRPPPRGEQRGEQRGSEKPKTFGAAKKFAKPGAQTRDGQARGADKPKTFGATKKFAKPSGQGRDGQPRGFGGPKKFAKKFPKKQARRKGRS
jgi:23S rRNA pseudouridine2605 synthase